MSPFCKFGEAKEQKHESRIHFKFGGPTHGRFPLRDANLIQETFTLLLNVHTCFDTRLFIIPAGPLVVFDAISDHSLT